MKASAFRLPDCMDVSIVVSSKNRRDDVLRFLQSLRDTRVAEGRTWELVFVDNNSTDDTAEVVRNFIPGAGYPVTYLLETGRGKSRGVNAGIRLSTGRFIALTDDDAIVPSGWVQAIIDRFDTDADSACVGGVVKPYVDDIAHVSIRLSEIPESADARNFAVTSIPVIGCNMSIRRTVLESTGLFDVDLGPGTWTKAAEDVDILYRIIRLGFRLDYVPEIWLYHNHDRRTPEQVLPVNEGYLLGRGAFYAKFVLSGDMLVARWAYWEVLGQLRRHLLTAPFNSRSRKGMRALYLLLKGAVGYLFHRSGEHVRLGND